MAVVTVSRQLGSHGARIARETAKELGYLFADKALINRVIRQYGLTQLDQIYDHKPKIWELFNDNSVVTIEMMNKTIAALAARGNVVILGRGGFKVLKGLPDVLNVFVKAPESVRTERIAKRDHTTADEALAVIKADDALRARFTRLFYSADWADESQFDLVLDTGVDDDASGVAKLVAAVAELPRNAEAGAAAFEVDEVLNKTIDEVLARRAAKAAAKA